MRSIRKHWTAVASAALFAAALGFGATQALAAPAAKKSVCEVFAEGGACFGGRNSDCTNDCLLINPSGGGAHQCHTRPDGACCYCL